MTLPESKLRKYLRKKDPALADRADNFWEISKPIIERQNTPNSNDNGLNHVSMVEHNCWRLANESNNLSGFSSDEIFILSCSACCHDFDKGLSNDITEKTEHGEGSGEFLLSNHKQLQQNFPEVIAIKNIIRIHDLPNDDFKENLQSVAKTFPIGTGPIKLQKLAVILKTADVLHTDNSRISPIGIDISKLGENEKKKHLARESITGWHIDGSRIIIKAIPQSQEALLAVEGCIEYIKTKEWPAISDKLSDLSFPSDLFFEVDSSACLESLECKELISDKNNLILSKDGSDIPPIVLNWVGRKKELAMLHTDFKVICITGIGGQGKSATAATFINDDKLKKDFEYIDWRDFKEEDHKFYNKLIAMITLVSDNSVSIGDLVGLTEEELISIFFKQLDVKKGLFILDNVDSYIDLEEFEPTRGIGKLLKAAITKPHKSKFIFTCRPFIRYANVDFYQLALDGFSEENTILYFQKSDLSIKNENLEKIASKAHQLTKGHPLWISLIVAQAKRGEEILTDFLYNLEINQVIDKDVSSLLSETILKEIWDSLNPKQKTLLRIFAESVRAETIDDFSEIASSELNYNAFSKSLRTLKNFNLIVEKREGKFVELHPLVKEFVRTKYPQNDRSKFISLFIRFYDKIVLVLKPRLSHRLSISEFENWISKVELHTNAREFQKAFDCIAEILLPMLAAGYVDELLRVTKMLFKSLTWRKKQIDSFNQLRSVLKGIVKASVEFGDTEFANYLIQKYESITETKEDNYILLCSLKGYVNWFIGESDIAISTLRKAEYLLVSGNQEDKHLVRHHLALSLRDSKEPEAIEESLKIFLQNEKLEIVSDSGNIDIDLSGHFYGNIGRCLQYNSKYDLSLNCYFKSFVLLFADDSSNRLLNLGYASKWISDTLFLKNDNEATFYFLKYASELWSKCSPPLANPCKMKLASKKQNSTITSILSLESWQIEQYCKSFINKHSNFNHSSF